MLLDITIAIMIYYPYMTGWKRSNERNAYWDTAAIREAVQLCILHHVHNEVGVAEESLWSC